MARAVTDADSRDEIVDSLAELWRDRGITMIFLTHDEAIAKRAPRTAVMDRGRISARKRDLIGRTHPLFAAAVASLATMRTADRSRLPGISRSSAHPDHRKEGTAFEGAGTQRKVMLRDLLGFGNRRREEEYRPDLGWQCGLEIDIEDRDLLREAMADVAGPDLSREAVSVVGPAGVSTG